MRMKLIIQGAKAKGVLQEDASEHRENEVDNLDRPMNSQQDRAGRHKREIRTYRYR